MAFISMIFVVIFIIVVILAAIGLLGAVLMVVSAIWMKKRKREGKKPSKICFVVGCVLFLIPITVGGMLALSVIVSDIKMQMQRKNYLTVTDKWRNEWVAEDTAAEEAITVLLEAADAEDKERLKEMFPQNAQGVKLDWQIDKFFEEYPKGLSQAEVKEERVYPGGGSYQDGKAIKDLGARYEIVLDNERYYITMWACYQNEVNPKEVGVTFFTVESEKAYVLDKKYMDTDYIFADTVVEEEFETRRIDGLAYRFNVIERSITKEEVVQTLKEERSIKNFKEKYGEPNVIHKYSNSNGTDYIYELQPSDGEKQYLKIDAVDDEIIIGLCYICGEEDEWKLWFDKNGVLKEDKN